MQRIDRAKIKLKNDNHTRRLRYTVHLSLSVLIHTNGTPSCYKLLKNVFETRQLYNTVC